MTTLAMIDGVWWTVICVASGAVLALGFRPLILKWMRGEWR